MLRLKLFIAIGLILLGGCADPVFAYEPKAKQIANTPAGNIGAINVQDAINELDSEKLSSFTESDPLSWLKATSQTNLTGDKSGSFNLNTTGTITLSAASGNLLMVGDGAFTDIQTMKIAGGRMTLGHAGGSYEVIQGGAGKGLHFCVNNNTLDSGLALEIDSVSGNFDFQNKNLITTGTLGAGAITGTSLALGTGSITMTGSIGLTGSRLTKGWFTDLQVTNAIAGSITGNAGSVTTNANLTGPITSVGNATSIASQTGTGTKFVVDTSPTLVTPNLGTPSTLVLTNATSLPASAVLAGTFGTGAYTMDTSLDISAANPILTLTDTTALAKSLKIDVDVNIAQIREKAGASGSLMTFDLVNNRVGIGTTSPAAPLHVDGNGEMLRLHGTAGVASVYEKLDNTGGNFYIGRENSAGSGVLSSGGIAYAAFLNDAGVKGIQFAIGSVVQATIDNSGNVGIGVTSPTSVLHLKAGTASANTAPLKFNSGTLLTTAEVGAIEFLTDDYYLTISTGAARKGIVLNDGANLTSGKIPVASTNGRLIDGQTPLSGTKIYYVSDTSGGAVTRKLTFINGILTSEV